MGIMKYVLFAVLAGWIFTAGSYLVERQNVARSAKEIKGLQELLSKCNSNSVTFKGKVKGKNDLNVKQFFNPQLL
jgi:hypothetical protein